MIDDIVIGLVLAALVFYAGLYFGSKHPLRREQRQLAAIRRETADAKAELQAVAPLKVRAARLHQKDLRLRHLNARHSELDSAIAKLDITIGCAQFKLEHRTLTTTEHAKLTREVTAAQSERSLLCGQRTTVITEENDLARWVKTESAALEDARSTAMIDLGLGHIEEVTVIA